MPHRTRRLSKMLLVPALALSLLGLSGPEPLKAQDSAQSATQETSLPQGVEKVASVEGITEYRLSNGLRVLLFPEPSKPTVTVNVTYMVGSASENYGETGMAHLLEHLMFKGSMKHPNIPQELTEHGARPNGSTYYDRTNYYETFQASEENLEWALDLESDRMVHSFIAQKDLDSEMTVVRNEFEMGENDPMGVLQERVLSTAYLWHNYGNSPIGARSDIENVPIERLQAFYRKFYQPDNSVLIVAGKIDEAETLKLVLEKFGPIPRPTRILEKTYTDEPAQDGERNVALRRVGDTQYIFAVYHVPSGSDPDHAAVVLAARILGDTPSGRLYKALVETQKASAVSAGVLSLHDPGVAAFMAEVREEKSLEEARDILLDTVEKAVESPVTEEELQRARTAVLKNIDLTLNDTEEFALSLSESIARGDWRLFFLFRDRIKNITLQEVRESNGRYFLASNRTLGLFYPTKTPPVRAEIPPVPDIQSMVKDYRGSAELSAGEAFDPSIENIESRTVRTAPASGLKAALLPKKTRGAAVHARISLHFGEADNLRNLNLVPDAAGRMLMRGTRKRSRQEIKDAFDRLQASVGISGSATGAAASLETKRENLPETLQLVAEILKQPSFPESEFEPMRQEWLAGLEQQRSDPQTLAILEIQRHLNPYPEDDVRYIPSLDEQAAAIRDLSLEDVRRFYNDFYGGSKMEFSIVGDFDEKAVVRLVRELFGSWESPGPYARIPDRFFDVPPVHLSIETPDKKNAMFLAGLNLKLRDDDPDFPALVLADYMLGGGFLNSRLAVRIRQKDGLSYGVGSQLSVDPLDEAGAWLMYAIAAPENTGQIETAFREEMARAFKDGFTVEEIEAAKAGYLQARQVNRAQDGSLCGKLASYLFLERTLEWDKAFEEKIRNLRPDQILSAMQRHLDMGKISIVEAGDFR
ncbi:MAG: insulinase family protein [Acidobacteria bacterium]|nr:insulinase family protein [Acidobacteriota bacterium]